MSEWTLENVEIRAQRSGRNYLVIGTTNKSRFAIYMYLPTLSPVGEVFIWTKNNLLRRSKRSLSSNWGEWFVSAVTARIKAANLVEKHAEMVVRRAQALAEKGKAITLRHQRQEAAGPALYDTLKRVEDAIADGGDLKDLTKVIARVLAETDAESTVPSGKPDLAVLRRQLQEEAGPLLYDTLERVQRAISDGDDLKDMTKAIVYALALAELHAAVPQWNADQVDDHQP